MKASYRLVSATRLGVGAFWQDSLLGQSLLRIPTKLRPELVLRFDNVGAERRGLSALYNSELDRDDDRPIVFVHDDVFLHDSLLHARVDEAMAADLDVVGLAGSRHGSATEPSWALSFGPNLEPLGWQQGPAFPGVELSGIVGHVIAPPLSAGHAPEFGHSVYGPAPATCDALDGLFLLVSPEACKSVVLRFDEQFEFHCYDVDFSRRAALRGLSVSTWPILVSHQSPGNFGSESWKAAARLYREKWRSHD